MRGCGRPRLSRTAIAFSATPNSVRQRGRGVAQPDVQRRAQPVSTAVFDTNRVDDALDRCQSVPIAHRQANTKAEAQSDANSDTDSDTHAPADPDTDADAHSHTYRDADPHAHTDTEHGTGGERAESIAEHDLHGRHEVLPWTTPGRSDRRFSDRP